MITKYVPKIHENTTSSLLPSAKPDIICIQFWQKKNILGLEGQ